MGEALTNSCEMHHRSYSRVSLQVDVVTGTVTRRYGTFEPSTETVHNTKLLNAAFKFAAYLNYLSVLQCI